MAKKTKNDYKKLCDQAAKMNAKDLINFHKAQTYIAGGVSPPAGKFKKGAKPEPKR